MKCNYCIEDKKEAIYLTSEDKGICKTCINKKTYANYLKRGHISLKFIGNINRYNLPLDHKYSIKSFSYGVCTCDNCNRLITNVAVISNEQGNEYQVGLDCASTLSLVDSTDFWKLKEQEKLFKKAIKYIKEIKNLKTANTLSILENEFGVYIFRKSDVTSLNSNWRFRFSKKFFDQYIKDNV